MIEARNTLWRNNLMRISVILSALFFMSAFSGQAAAEPRAFHNFQADVPATWTLVSETISADQQSTLVKFVSNDQKVNLSVNMENTVRPGAEAVARLVEIYGGDKVFKPFKDCGDTGFRQRNPGGGWLALCSVGSNKMMSLVLDGRETREAIRFVSSIRDLGYVQPAPAEPEPKPGKVRSQKSPNKRRTSK